MNERRVDSTRFHPLRYPVLSLTTKLLQSNGMPMPMSQTRRDIAEDQNAIPSCRSFIRRVVFGEEDEESWIAFADVFLLTGSRRL